MKLARKLTLALILGVLLVLASSAYFRARREAGRFEKDVRRNSHTMARALATAVVEVWRTDGEARALRLVTDANERESQIDIRWVWLDGEHRDAHTPRLSPDDLAPARAGKEVVKKVLRDKTWWIVTCVPVPIPRQRAGALELSESLAGERDHVRATVLNTIAATAALALVIGLITTGLGIVLVGRPMHALMEHARRIGAGDFSGRPTRRQEDEIGEMAEEMNRMCDRLRSAQEAVLGATASRIAALEQLRHAERLATVGKLASGIAHELGTPLQIVGGRAGMIADGDAEPGEAVEHARIIVEQSQRMTRIIRQLLDFARRRTVDKATVDLGDVVRDTLRLLAPLAQKARVAVQHEAAGGPVEILGDAEQLEQALTNVVVNAVQAMPRGGTVRVSIDRRPADPPADHPGPRATYVALSVRDEGEGMTPEVRDHVFEPFYTTKPVGEGTGLGLSVAYGIVCEHGGWIDVDAAPGRGSVFTCYFPEGRTE